VNQGQILQELTQRTGKPLLITGKCALPNGKSRRKSGKADQGLRSAVTGGAQMDGFIDLFTEIISQLDSTRLFLGKRPLTPGFFRPPKNGSLVVKNKPDCRVEAKSSGRPFLRQQCSIIEPRRRWAAPLIFGLLFRNGPISRVHSHFRVYFSCLRIASVESPRQRPRTAFQGFTGIMGAST